LPEVSEDERRRARNEALFREVNERIAELETGRGGYDRDDSLLTGFVCECPREDCSEMLEVTRGQYEGVRDDPRRFLVLPGHEDGDIAKVVERHESYLVVEKTGEAAAIAEEQDPRS
jgi:PHD/YefM family antitoxin component YafN of YafNO toxin-antitoxin module